MHLVPRLQREGWRVRALVRDAARAGLLSRADVTLATGDVLEPTGFERAARGCDVVFHAAAVITPRGGREAYRTAERGGHAQRHRRRHECKGASGARQQCRRLRRQRSLRGRRPEDRRERSASGALPKRRLYARSKRESEDLVFAAQRTGALWATAVRPVASLYGPFDRQFIPRLARTLRHGFAPVVDGRTQHTRDRARGQRRRRNGARGAARCGEWPARSIWRTTTTSRRAPSSRPRARGWGSSCGIVSVPTRRRPCSVRCLPHARADDRRRSVQRGSERPSLNFLARDNPFSSELARTGVGLGSARGHTEEGVVEAFRWWAAHH